jgi:hypothetical protein
MDIEGIKTNFVYTEEQLYELIQRGIDSYYDEELNKFDIPTIEYPIITFKEKYQLSFVFRHLYEQFTFDIDNSIWVSIYDGAFRSLYKTECSADHVDTDYFEIRAYGDELWSNTLNLCYKSEDNIVKINDYILSTRYKIIDSDYRYLGDLLYKIGLLLKKIYLTQRPDYRMKDIYLETSDEYMITDIILFILHKLIIS